MNGIKQEQDFGRMANSSSNDALDSLIDFSQFDGNNMSYHSPSLSPTASSKATFSRPTPTATTPISVMTTAQPLSGPSHDYDMYKQQTGIVPGALATTLAVNENNAQISGYNPFNLEEFLGMSNPDNMFDFNTSPSQQTADMDVEFDSPAETSFFFDSTVNPSVIGGQDSQSLPSPPAPASTTSSVGRVWPGMHQQAALAKAQAQQRQQQQLIHQQQQQRQRSQSQNQQPQQQQPKQRTKSVQPSDPLVEQKITQLLNSMRSKASPIDGSNQAPVLSLTRSRKEEDDMDEDERLLASEEGKKLSSKERRQLRNKVSARAFRSRRKEYISQLEAEIATKVTENGDLRVQNRALIDENKRLQDLTRMLLSSPSFSNFLDRLSSNPSEIPQAPQPAPQVEQRQETRQIPKDINPYSVQSQRQQIGMAMIPEQTMDFSMLSIDTDTSAFNFQPQVFAVMETPEIILPPSVETSVLSGKSSNFVGNFTSSSEDEKVEAPVIECRDVVEEEAKKVEAPATPVVIDEEFENDPQFALYHDYTSTVESEEPTVAVQVTLSPEESDSEINIFGGIETEKALARFELVDSAEEELAMARFERLSARMESMVEQLEKLMS